jgi:hypothetical protein
VALAASACRSSGSRALEVGDLGAEGLDALAALGLGQGAGLEGAQVALDGGFGLVDLAADSGEFALGAVGGVGGLAADSAGCLLLYGVWLRRARRTADARDCVPPSSTSTGSALRPGRRRPAPSSVPPAPPARSRAAAPGPD